MNKEDYIAYIQECPLLTYDMREQLLSQAQDLSPEERESVVTLLSERAEELVG